MYQALYRKYRPSCFKDVVGEEHITDILQNELSQNKIFHAYLFTGPRGTGKTSCAKILAKAVNCHNSINGDACCECESCKAIENGEVLDIVEIDAASNNGVENIRDLKEQVSYTPTQAKYRVYIIDEVHMLSIGAFNALLKTLEEPPAHIIFILATTEVHKLPATILSRCQRFDFHRISSEKIADRIEYIAEKENFEIDRSAAEMIAALSDGGMRDALSTLDLCLARDTHITEEICLQVCSLAGSNYCLELAEMIKNSDVGAALEKVDNLHKNAVDLQRLTSELISHYRNLMIAKTVKDTSRLIVGTKETLDAIKNQAESYALEGIVNAINVFVTALDRMTASERRTELEMAIIKLCNPILDTSPTALLDRLERLERTFKYSTQSSQTMQTTSKKEEQAETEQSKQTRKAPAKEPVVEQVSDDEIPLDIPPQNNDGMYEPIEEATFEPAKPEIKAEQQQNALPVFEAWQDVLAELVKTAPLMAASLNGSTAYLSDDIILIDSQNDQFFSLVRSDPIYRSQIKQAVQSVVGRTYRLGPYKKKVQETGDPLKDIMNKLKNLEVPQ